MNSVKVLHCADVHIGALSGILGENAAKRRFETLLTFEKIISEAIERKVDFLLISGDLFDSNSIDSELIDRTFEAFKNTGDIKVIYCAGNHDPLNSTSPFLTRNLPENLYVLGTEDECISFADKGVRIYGRSFEDSSQVGKNRFSITPPDDDIINIMVLHGELKSDLNSQYNAITPEFVKSSKMDYIALGHVHKKSGILKLENTSFAYCGCPEGQGFDELDDKGVYIGEIKKHSAELEFLPVSKRRYIEENIDISALSNSAEIAAEIINKLKLAYGEDYSQNLYKIILVGEVDENVIISKDEILSRLDDELYFAKLKDKTEIRIDLELLANEVSLKGIFTKNMLSLIEKAENNEEKERLRDALKLGLTAFKTEVFYNED
ncbi:MAG: DNA repair exonuclease [Ruminococcaceae bacterium]|nr:DNA repair exonuclease [Oscillospiraceae bacterium]